MSTASPTDTEPTTDPRSEDAVSVDSGLSPYEIGCAPAAEWYPLSSGQLAMWLTTQGGGSHGAYAVPGVYRLSGVLDGVVLRRAFEDLLRRHESLRTAFGVVDGVPRQRVVPGVELDWSLRVAGGGDGGVTGVVEEFVGREFDLSAGRLLRVLLVRESADEHVLVVVAHHIAVDGWSLTVLIDQVMAAYQAFSSGGVPAIEAPQLQYKDYAVWQQALLDSGEYDASRVYWRERFGEGPEPLDLPTDRPRPAVRTYRGETTTRTFRSDVLRGLKGLCREERATLFGGLSAVLRVLLLRYTGQRDVVLGTSAATRSVPELYEQIGCYINSIGLRDEVCEGAAFRELLRTVQGTLQDGLRHHEYPFDRVVRDAGLVTDTNRNPLFDVMILVGNAWGRPSATPDGLRVESLGATNGHSKMDLTFFFEETSAGLRASVEYSTELFGADRVERMLDHFGVLLEEVVAGPDRAVESFGLLTPGEREQVVHGFNRTEVAYDLDSTVTQLFEEQVVRTPEAVATVDEEGSLTFAELNARANAVAWTLREVHGVGAGDLVALHLERSVHMTVAVLGVLKAGGAYLPINTADPVERATAVVEDSGSKAVLVAGSSVVGGRPVLDVTDHATLSGRTDNPPLVAGPNDLAYCIYTSGSTGRPKGVLIEHRSLVNRLHWATEELGYDASDVFLQKTPYSFDVSVPELLLPGIIGAKQVMLRPGGESDPEAIRATIQRHGVTTLHFVPSMLSHYLATVDNGFTGVRVCVCSGEELTVDMVDQFFARTSGTGTVLHNWYGPTEAAVEVSASRPTARSGPVTLGRPAPNNRLYVVDERGEPCPVGVTGELCIGGVQVARGYLNRPELTADRFMADPFVPGGRIYRTGDLARWLPDGEVLYLGRRDNQIKIRGHRIELGEIEQALRDLPGVERAVVLAQRDGAGSQFLCAYLQAGAACLPADQVRQALSTRLPRYMVPSRYLRIEETPVTRNGKVDRGALLRMAGAELAAGEHVEASTDAERALVEIWRSLLPVERLGVTDDFFAVGGHSLLALQLASRVNQHFGTDLQAATVFTHRTITAQAELLRNTAESAPGTRAELRPAPAAEWYPLSSGQLAMWLTTQGGGSHGAYAVPGVYRLSGVLDGLVLRRAFEDLLRRHESLRTAFGVVDGVPRQRVVPGVELDWSLRVAGGGDGGVTGVVEEFVGREFDLSAGRLLRVLLVRESADEHVLVVVAHHIAVDGWSLTVLIDQVMAAYQAFSSGGVPAIEAPQLQYKDYAVWQQALLDDGALDSSRDYWRERFGEGPEPLDLPTDRPRPAVRTYRGEIAGRVYHADVLRGLKELCNQERATLFGGLSAVLRVLLLRYTGQRDVVLGTSAATRSVPELYEQIGCYINSIGLRDEVCEGAAFRELLRTVQGTLQDGLRHHEYPFDRVVRDAGVVTDTNRNPLFDVMILVDHAWGNPTETVEGIRIQGLGATNGHSKMDLTFFFEETPAGLRASVEYSTELFDADRVERMLDHFGVLLEEVVAGPDRAVESFGLLTPGEREQVVHGFNRTDVAYDLDSTVTQLFEEQVVRTPEAVATVDEEGSLTFAELNARANAVAWTLREVHGVGAGDLVALHLERSVHMTVAVLGVLKAGGAYLPINTADPVERATAVVEDSGSKAVLVAGSSVVGGRPVLDVTDHATLSGRTDNPPLVAGPNDLAYCIYTSGSTGRPKGVLIEHRSLVNRLHWMTDDLGLGADDVFLQKTTYSFDVSVWELLLPGIIGAKQVMLRPGGESDPEAIRATIQRHGVTTLHFVPSMLSHYLATVDNGFTGVRVCVCSGEELDQDLARRFLDAAAGTGARLFNYYGPTEAAVDVTTLLVADPDQPVTLGRPAPNNRLYVVDERGEACPVGVTGELCIGGVQVARGYLNRPELTADRFMADPFVPGGRIYRTGDLARWLPDGEVLYLGRRDNQIKIRGHRIELGEIEQALRDLPGVERAVVLAQRDGAGTQFLCAYLQAGSACLPADQVRQALSTRLPRYMVPSRYLRVEETPVTRNGKVDRGALLRMAGAELAAGEHVEASTDAERALVEIWRSLLPVERLGVTDDFFAVGGHSLLALQLASRVNQHFGTDLQAATVFTHRTITAQAELLRQPCDGTRATPVEPVARGERHVLSYAQERMWFLHMLDPDSTAYHIRTLAAFHGPFDTESLRAALADLVDRHELLRVTYDTVGGEPCQRQCPGLPLAFDLVDLSGLGTQEAEEAVARVVREDDTRPFRLREESPVRFTLLKLGDTEHRLLTTLHHIAGDGWSVRLLMRELSALYARRTGGVAEPLPELPVQYIDYAAAVRDPAHQKAVEGDLTYWGERLADAPALELPTDVPDRDTRRGSGRVGLTLSAAHGRLLRDLAERTSTTPFEITMAALNLLLSRLGDQQDMVVGYPVANRKSVELEGIVGLFLNTLVLRTDLSGDPVFADLLGRVRTGIHEAYAHQSAPFELLVERLNPVRRLDRTPVFDVLLNYMGSLREEAEIEGLAVDFDDQLFEPEAKFPLTFYVWDEDTDAAGGSGEAEAGRGPHIELVYRPDLFSPARAATMLRQFGGLLEQVADSAEQPLSAYTLALAGPADSRRRLKQPLDVPAQRPVTELIAARAAADPDRAAVAQGARSLSYGELVRRSEAVARQLLAQGCRPGQVVTVTGPRGIGFCVAMLGVLRSGAVFFPLDPALPEARREHLLKVGRPTLCVHAEAPVPAVDPLTGEAQPQHPVGLPTLVVDAHTGLMEREALAGVLPPVDPDGPAYLFFTSGTTGTPRGVLGRHASLSHFLNWQSSTFGIGAQDRCAQLTGASFDVMLRDTLLALVSGGTTVVPEPTDVLGGKAVFSWLERERISVLHAVPTLLQTWLPDAPGLALPWLRLTFLAGEPLKAALVERYRSAFPGVGEIVNLYGPTETTMAKFAHRLPAQGPLPPVLPVGSPLPDTQGIVMRDGAVCGVGEPGEIVIRTPFRTLGYLDDPDASTAAFFRNPVRSDADDLLYHTGDIGRLRPDGLLEILGRADHQIKISGVRIHPSEIEHALVCHPQVSACVVVAHKTLQDEYHLVAYVVPDASAELDGLPGRLRRHLIGQLPQPMVPAEFIVLDRIPANPNGKPDRAALPAPRFLDSAQAPAEAPRSDTELRIRDAWKTALARPVPGVEQDFFELGGTSLKLLRLYSLLEESFPGAFRVAQLFTHPTIALQARLAAPASGDADPTHCEDEVSEHDF